MANSNFVVHNGLTVGQTIITASTGNIDTLNVNTSTINASNAILNNLTVTGNIPALTTSGAVTASSVSANTATLVGNLTITGNTSRIVGDFSSIPQNGRLAFQTSSPNDTTSVGVLPSGTGVQSQLIVHNTSDASNSGRLRLMANTTETQLSSDIVGSGSYLPLLIQTNGTTQVRIDTQGNLLVVGSGALGYGSGSGGNVVQGTSKTTAVTLNKSAGRITTANTSMTTNQVMYFTLNNSFIGPDDVVSINASGRNGAYIVNTASVHAGNANIRLVNVTGGTLAENVNINFAVIKTSQI